MKYTKNVPTKDGFYWVKWGEYKGFVCEIFLDDFGVFIYSPIDGKTKIYLSDDPMHFYSDSPIPEPV